MALDLSLTLLESGHYSDFTMQFGNHVYHLHKAIVCAQSQVIKLALDSEFKEGETQSINMGQFGLDIAKAVLRFLYGDTNVLDEPDLAYLPSWYAENPGDSFDACDYIWSQTKEPSDLQLYDHYEVPNVGPDGTRNNITLEPPTTLEGKLAFLIHINAAADYLMINSLKSETRQRILDVLEERWSARLFAGAATLVIRESGDLMLQTSLSRLAAKMVTALIDADIDLFALSGLEGFGTYVSEALTQMYRSYKSTVKRECLW